MRLIISVLLIMLGSCSPNEFYESSIQEKPAGGYNRHKIFDNYLFDINTEDKFAGYLGTQLKNRTVWNAENNNFRSKHSSFQVDLIAFNQLSAPKNFSWQERILFSDALELVTFAINHPMFLDEMRKHTFYDNSRTMIIPADVIVQEIREARLQIILGKNTLDYNVLAVASIGGMSSTIWFRDDTDYQHQSVIFLSIVLAHELMHNLGYRHVSNVPYGVHEPVYNVLLHASFNDSLNFVRSTPFFEDDFLHRVRTLKSARTHSIPSDVEKDYKHDFHF